jgi:hypothetical protein
LLSVGAEFCVFQVAIQKYKDEDTQNHNFACCFVWVLNVIVHIERGTQTEGFQDIGAEENI